MEKKYKLSLVAAFSSLMIQALVINIVSLLFVPIRELYGISYEKLGMLVGIMFVVQMSADLFASYAVDRLGYKYIMVPAGILAIAGLIHFGLTPYIYDDIYLGIVISCVMSAFSAGLVEVVASPMVESIPSKNKGQLMSFTHSFYAWGQIVTIIITTITLKIIGYANWNFIVLGWVVVPIAFVILSAKCWYPSLISKEKKQKRMDLLKNPYFLLCLLAIMFGGASEIMMNQWASAYLENSIKLPKIVGDLLGLCSFVFMMGVGRTFYAVKGHKLSMSKTLIACSIGAIFCYLTVALSPYTILNIIALSLSGFFVSLMWPGVITIASGKFPYAGAFLFGILAIFGDMGAAIAPPLIGSIMDNAANLNITKWMMDIYNVTAEQASMRVAILIATVLPLCTLIVHIIIYKMKKKEVLPLEQLVMPEVK